MLWPLDLYHLRSFTSLGLGTLALHVKKRFLPTALTWGPSGLMINSLDWRLWCRTDACTPEKYQKYTINIDLVYFGFTHKIRLQFWFSYWFKLNSWTKRTKPNFWTKLAFWIKLCISFFDEIQYFDHLGQIASFGPNWIN